MYSLSPNVIHMRNLQNNYDLCALKADFLYFLDPPRRHHYKML